MLLMLISRLQFIYAYRKEEKLKLKYDCSKLLYVPNKIKYYIVAHLPIYHSSSEQYYLTELVLHQIRFFNDKMAKSRWLLASNKPPVFPIQSYGVWVDRPILASWTNILIQIK